MSKQAKVQVKLHRALETPSIYRVARRFGAPSSIHGFIVGLGSKWVLIARTADGGYPDGLIAVRTRDVTDLAKDRSFETEFAMTQPQPRSDDLTAIQLERTDRVIETMASLASLVAVERDGVRAGSIWIGQYKGKRGKWFRLLEVSPDASWDRTPLRYRLREVTSVSINSHYLTALAVTAPEAP